MEIKCKVCGKLIKVRPSLVFRKKYCSKKCLYLGRPKRELKTIKCICKQCNKEFEGIPSEVKRKRSLFCSRECYFNWRKNNRTIICKECGKIFLRRNSFQRFCSYNCWVNYYQKIGWKKRIHKEWKGKNGYIIKGGFNGAKLEHRIIWEKYYGKIPKDHIIHHLNGKRSDNRIGNLALVSRKKHEKYTLIKIHKKRILELEEQVYNLKKKIKEG